MAPPIDFIKHPGLIVRHIHGSPDVEELKNAIHENYQSFEPKICWVLQPDASGKNLKIAEAKDLAQLTGIFAEKFPGGKSAIVAPEHFEFAMGRIIETHSGLMDLPFEVKVFRTKEEAADWLGVSLQNLEK